MNIKCLSALFILGCCAVQAEANPSSPLTLEDVLEASYFNNKEWCANRTDKRVADEKYKLSKRMFLPDIRAYVGTSRSKEEAGGNYNGIQVPDQTKMTTKTNLGIRVQQNLFNGFTTVNSMKAASFEADAAFHKLRLDEQKLIVKVIEAYANVWFCVRRVDALKKKEENLHKTLLSQQTSLEAGMITQTEVSSANADYNRAIFERISAETELFSAEAEFEKITGLKARKDLELPSLELDLPKSLDKLIAHALLSSNAILSAKFTEQAALKALSAARGKLAPSCDLTLETGRSLSKVPKVNEGVNNYSASLEVSIPINVSQNNLYSQIEIANQQALKTKFTAEEAVLETKKECVKNWNLYIATDAMIKSSKTAVESEELNSESYIEQTALGMKSNTDIWVRENKLLDSRIGLADSQRRKIVASVNLLMQTGDLSMHSLLSKIKKSPSKTTNKKVIKVS